MAQLFLTMTSNPSNPWQILRIGALLVAILTMGIVIGRLSATAPKPSARSLANLDALAKQSGDMLTKRYDLDEESEKSVRVIVDRIADDMRPFDELAPVEALRKRRDVWRSYLPEIREAIPSQHRDDLDGRITVMERRFERSIRRRERQVQ